MAGRAKYTDADKARVYVALQANEGNVKRTAREIGLPENTVRRWRDDWARNGAPPTEEVAQALGDFIGEAVLVRDFAITTLKKKIPDAKPSELITIIGVLDDKITRARGLATNRTEHVHTLPAAEEIRELMAGFVRGALQAAELRQGEIVDAEIVEQPALGLPPAKP